jgi:hypothetical protein
VVATAVHADNDYLDVFDGLLSAQQALGENSDVPDGFSTFLASCRFGFAHFLSTPFSGFLG